MLYLPDTNVWIKHLNPAPSMVKKKLSEYPPVQIALCDVVKAEPYYGAFKSARREENLVLLETLFSEFSSYAFDGEAARTFGEIREKRGQARISSGSACGPCNCGSGNSHSPAHLFTMAHSVSAFQLPVNMTAGLSWQANR